VSVVAEKVGIVAISISDSAKRQWAEHETSPPPSLMLVDDKAVRFATVFDVFG
jgi:hypothetical protein